MADRYHHTAKRAEPMDGPHHPLNCQEPEFRLLNLKAGILGDQIQCELYQKPLSGAGGLMYESVSYCWGDKTQTSTIEVDGHTVRIPQSANDALHRFRLAADSRTLWMDSICINQSDTTERSSRVAQMHAIYKSAARNLIYLGPDDGSVSEALKTVATLVEEIRRETKNFVDFYDMIYPKTKGRGGFGKAKSSITSLDLDPLLTLFAKPWFGRLWIVQEASLATSNLCHCGINEFQLLDLLRVAKWLRFKADHLQFDINDHPSILSIALLNDFVDREFCWFWLRTRSLHNAHLLLAMLSSMQYFDVSDPRDHVFGLLGMYQQYSGDTEIPPLLQPDYCKSLVDILRDATRLIIIKGKELSTLGYVSHRIDHHTLPLPSWVPRWHQPFDHTHDAKMIFGDGNAHGGTNAVGFDVNPKDPDVLTVRGLFVDQLHGAVVSTLTEPCINDAVFDRLLNLVIEMETSENNIRYETACLKGPAATIVTAQNTQAGEIMDQYVECFQALLVYRKITGKPYPLASQSYGTVDMETDEILRQQALRFVNEAKQVCHRRRLFITSSGRLGLGPQTMRDGDMAVVLYGGRWPFILRPNGEEYKFIGDSYVYGVMQGEAVVRHRDIGDEDESFSIR